MLLLEQTVLLTIKRICRIQYLTRVCNHYPSLTLLVAGLRIYIGKRVIVKTWYIVRVKRTTVPILEYWDTNDFLWRRIISNSDVLSNNTKLVNFSRRQLFSQNNEFITCSRGKVKFSSSLSGSPTCSDSFQWHLALKSNPTLVHGGLWNHQWELRWYHLESLLLSL